MSRSDPFVNAMRTDPLLSSAAVNLSRPVQPPVVGQKRNVTDAFLDTGSAPPARHNKQLHLTEDSLVEECMLSDNSTDFWSPGTTVRKY